MKKNSTNKDGFLNEDHEEIFYELEDIKKKDPLKHTEKNMKPYFNLISKLDDLEICNIGTSTEQVWRICRAYVFELIRWAKFGEEDTEILHMTYGYLKGYEQLLLHDRRLKYRDEVSKYLKDGSVDGIFGRYEQFLEKALAAKIVCLIEKGEWTGIMTNTDLNADIDVAAVDPKYYKTSYLAGRGREKEGETKIIKAVGKTVDSEGLASDETGTVSDDFAISPTDTERNWGKSVLTNIAPINYDFVCRSCELEEIKRRFAAGSHLEIIAGMSGVGKTQIALQYANSHVMNYDIVWWIHVGDDSAMIGDLKTFLLDKELVKDDETDLGRLTRKFINYLNKTDETWFLVYDNCNFESDKDYERFNSLLPVSVKGQVLVTTQTSLSFNGKAPIEIDPFDEPDACIFLQRKTGLDIDQSAKEIISTYGGHALALEYAASYIKINRASYSAYLEGLTKDGISKMLENKRRDVKSYEYSAYVAFQITIERILSGLETQEEKDEITAFIALWSAFPVKNFHSQTQGTGNSVDRVVILDMYENEKLNYPYKNLFKEKDSYNTIIAILKSYSLIQTNGGHMSIHPLTGAFAASMTKQKSPDYLDEIKQIISEEKIVCYFSTPDTHHIKVFSEEERSGWLVRALDFCEKTYPDMNIVSLTAYQMEQGRSIRGYFTLDYKVLD